MEWWLAALIPVIAAGALGVGRWLTRTIVAGVIDDLDDRLGLDEVRAALNPGPTGWPNGSTTLPDSVREIYRRQSETHESGKEHSQKLDDVLHQLEQLLTDTHDG